MKRDTKAIILLTCLLLVLGVLAGCTQADKVSANISNEADAFNVVRRITVMNLRSDRIIYEMIGTLSLKGGGGSANGELQVIVRTGPNTYKKHFIYLNSWTSYVVEDVTGADVSPYHYEINFLPETLIPITFKSTYGGYSEDQIITRPGDQEEHSPNE